MNDQPQTEANGGELYRVPSTALLCVNFGGGTNSTAMLCGFMECGIVPDLILFADTGAEMPYTYEHVEYMDQKTKQWWGRPIETVRYRETIIQSCERFKMLPSLAYGHRSCSQKFKHQPMEKRRKAWMKERDVCGIIVAIGIDAGEPHRMKFRNSEREILKGYWERHWYPLADWGWSRSDCYDAICRHKIPKPRKSSCFICPAMKQNEIVKLKRDYPHLYGKAVDIEKHANGIDGLNKQKIGLTGRDLFWSDIGNQDEKQTKLWDFLDQYDEEHRPCNCNDG